MFVSKKHLCNPPWTTNNTQHMGNQIKHKLVGNTLVWRAPCLVAITMVVSLIKFKVFSKTIKLKLLNFN